MTEFSEMDYFHPHSNKSNNTQADFNDTKPRPSHSKSPPAAAAQYYSRTSSPHTIGHSHDHTQNAASSASPSATRIRRRNRMITSCLECRRRKLKCNKSHPCTNCMKFSRDCVFLAPALDQASQLKLTEIKEKVGSLERLLERDVAKSSLGGGGVGSPTPSQDRALPDDGDDDLPANEDERDLEPTPLATIDAAYVDDGDDDDLLDLGIQLGKMRFTERIGGFFRPKIAQELEFTMTDDFTSGFRDSTGFMLSPPQTTEPLPPASEWLKPGPGYIAPPSGFFFGQSGQAATLIDFLPSRLAADRLIKQYFTAVHPVTQIVHRPTFEKEYDAFWDEVSLGIEPPSSVQTIVFAAMFSGVVSMDEPTIIRDFGVSKSSLIDNFRLGTETALGRANFLRTTKIETLQAFVMYLIPLCRAEVSRAHSVLVGAAIRMAECMGLHRDGETYGMNPLETHVRRLIWHQLCFLDIRTCESQGPKPQIRLDDYDTKLPLNVDDSDLHASGKPPVSADRWTDATLSLIRFEANEMMRTIWTDRPRIERRKISLTAVLAKIETFKTNMAAKYDHLMDDRTPLQKYAKIVKKLLTSRLHIMVLHRYNNSVKSPIPERLRNIMIASGTTTLETAIALETQPEVRTWAWYSGAYQQYHSAFLLLMVIYAHPNIKEADRIWACLDWVYECDPSESRGLKARKILSELQRKMAVYQSLRGMRAPVAMEKKRAQIFGDKSPDPAPQMDKAHLEVHSMARGTGVVPDVSNCESFWAMPNARSPEANSDTNSVVGHGFMPGDRGGKGGGADSLMVDIDWDAFDALFPPEQHNDEANQSGFFFPSIPGVGATSGYGR